MKWFLQGLKNYAVFSGRTPRNEFWFYVLFGYLIGWALYVVDLSVGTYSMVYDVKCGFLSGAFTLFLLIPNTAISIRRLHDTGRSGVWMLLIFLPILGTIALTILWCLASTPGDNIYGPSPAADAPGYGRRPVHTK